MTYERELLDGAQVLGTRSRYTGLSEGGVLVGGKTKHHEFHHDLNNRGGKRGAYIDFVKEFRKQHPNLSWKEALVAAKPEYHRMNAPKESASGRKKPQPKTSPGTYVDFVREYRKHHPELSWKEAMLDAKSAYRQGTGETGSALAAALAAGKKDKSEKAKPIVKKKAMTKSMQKEVGAAIAGALAAGTHAIVPIDMIKKPKKEKAIKTTGHVPKQHIEGVTVHHASLKKRGRPKKK